MDETRIRELVKFFYSSDDSKDVPLRVAVISGGFSGFDLSPDNFQKLMRILSNSVKLKEDLTEFLNDAT